MKTALLKTAFAAILVMFALFLGTCAPQIPEGQEEGGIDYTDVEYEITGGIGNERVKSIKLYLDGVKVPVTSKQRAIQRALSHNTAAASHDFFEVVFVDYTAPMQIARVQWEIGYPAGLNGLRRGDSTLSTPTIKDYRPIYGTTNQCSTVFVGRKQNKTLLGVGWLTHVNDVPASGTVGVDDKTYSVTFTVAPLKTWVGFNGVASDSTTAANNVRQRSNFYNADDTQAAGAATFVTATGATRLGTAPQFASSSVANTRGRPANLTPVQGSTVTYPLFSIPIIGTGDTDPKAGDIIEATYTIGGLTFIPIPGTGILPPGTPASGGTVNNALLDAIRIYGVPNGTGNINQATGVVSGNPRGGLEVIKRKPAYVFNGRTYQAGSIYDSFTGIALYNYTGAPTYNHGISFVNTIPLRITLHAQTAGIFAFTFQCPVFAITTLIATNDNSTNATKFTKWFVRPADGPDLYLLDNGIADGGMVMIGDLSSLTDDWIEVTTTGIGFNNN